MRHEEPVKIRGCRIGDRCRAHIVDDPTPRLLRGWACGSCQVGNVVEFFGRDRGDPGWPPEMIFEGETK